MCIRDSLNRAQSGRAAYVVITSERGLAGGYNANVLKMAYQHMKTYEPVRVYAIGNVAYDFFLEHHLEPNVDYLHAIDIPHLQEARQLSWELCQLFIEGHVDQVLSLIHIC